MSFDKIADDFVNLYWAEDGLARLDTEDTRSPFSPEHPRTVNNQNGILFLAEILLEFYLKAPNYIDHEWYSKARQGVERLRVGTTSTFNRRASEADHHDAMNSHDNIIGLVILGQILPYHGIIRELDDWGQTHFWSFNNLIPTKFSFRSFLLPHNQAIIRMANGRFPGIISSAWLVLSALLTTSKHKRLMRLRMESVKISSKMYGKRSMRFIAWALNLWWKSWGGYARFARECAEYYKDESHPYRRLTAIF